MVPAMEKMQTVMASVRLSYSDMDIGKAVSIQGMDTKN